MARFYDKESFGSQCIYWFGHALLCASPSFFLGLISGHTVWGMSAGIITFIALYASVTSSSWYRNRHKQTLFGKAVHYGARLRSALSLLFVVSSLLSIFPTRGILGRVFGYLTMPDMICGLVAIQINSYFYGFNDGQGPCGTYRTANPYSVSLECNLFTYTTTLTDGVLLSGTLLLCVLLILGVLKFRRTNI